MQGPRKEIVISVAHLKNKMPEMGQSQTSSMAFALVTNKGKKLNVHKIDFQQDSSVVQRTQERMNESLKQK
jgi:hypothetical protein